MKQQVLSLVLFTLSLCVFTQESSAQASGVKPELVMYRHNGSSSVSPLPVVSGNILGNLRWKGLTEIGAVRTGASIQSTAKLVAPGVLHANMVFSTSSSNAAPWEPNPRMIITENGLVGVGTMTPLFHFDVEGNTHTSGRFYGRIHFDTDSPTNDAPNTYHDEAYFERKNRSVLGIPAMAGVNDFGGILSLAPGNNAHDHQLFFGQDGIWNRRETANAASWSASWEKLLSSGDIQGTPNLIARFLPPNSPSNKIGDSQIFDDGTDIGIGTVTPDAAYLLTIGGDTRINGQVNASGNAAVGGTTTTNALQVTNNTTTGSLNVVTTSEFSGNVGIGTAPTTFGLDVAGDANFRNRLKIGANNFPGDASYTLSVGGGIMAEEVRVQLQPWPDYVFEADYELQPLAAVEQYVQTNKHLPGVACAAEVAEKGLDVGQTQKVQMEKIEELFLHLIAMEKRINALEAENAALKATQKN
jgi:hypothetical protein